MNNLHISLTEFRNESRVLKETSSIVHYGIADKVYIASLYASDLEKEKRYSERLILNRFELKSRNLSKHFFVQVFKYIEFVYKVTFFYQKKAIKMVNVHSIALLPLGVLLKYFYGAKLVYDTHELETETSGLHGFRKTLVKWMEKVLIHCVDLVFVVSENIADWYAKEYGIQRPTVILNAPKQANYQKTNHFREKLGIKNDSLIVLYQGGLTTGRGVELLLKTFLSRDNDNVVIVFMGYGELEHVIQQASRDHNTVFFHTAVAPEIVLEYTASADIGVSFIENTCLSYFFCLPNKLFEYAMAGLPVIVSDMKEMKEMVERYNMGVVVTSETTEAINGAIEQILASDMATLKRNARRCAEENAWEVQEIKMIHEYRRVVYAQ